MANTSSTINGGSGTGTGTGTLATLSQIKNFRFYNPKTDAQIASGDEFEGDMQFKCVGSYNFGRYGKKTTAVLTLKSNGVAIPGGQKTISVYQPGSTYHHDALSEENIYSVRNGSESTITIDCKTNASHLQALVGSIGSNGNTTYGTCKGTTGTTITNDATKAVVYGYWNNDGEWDSQYGSSNGQALVLPKATLSNTADLTNASGVVSAMSGYLKSTGVDVPSTYSQVGQNDLYDITYKIDVPENTTDKVIYYRFRITASGSDENGKSTTVSEDFEVRSYPSTAKYLYVNDYYEPTLDKSGDFEMENEDEEGANYTDTIYVNSNGKWALDKEA